MQPTVAGRCGVVTNATHPIGRAVALELARDGARVAVGYHGYRGADFEAAERLVHDVVALGGEAIPLRLPVDNVHDLEELIELLVAHWGRLDFVVDIDDACVFGRAALPWLLERGRGRIVHVGVSAVTALQASTGDVQQLARHGIAINSILVDDRDSALASAPGPQDVATTAFFMIAQDCHLTGQVIDLRQRRTSRPVRRGARRRVGPLQRSTCRIRRLRLRDSSRQRL